MKKTISAIIMLAMIISISFASASAYASEGITVYVNGQQVYFDVQPQTINGRTMVPIRAIFEFMGASVAWDDASQTAVCTKNYTTVKMTVNSNTMYINDTAYTMDTAPVVISGRTLAPARFVAESFGADVQWDETAKSVLITEQSEKTVTLYAPDGRTISVYESEVPAYLNVGWFSDITDVQQTLYAPDGRTVTVYKQEVASYLNVGWYETAAQAQASIAPPVSQGTSYSQPAASAGNTVYIGQTGTKYHKQTCSTLKGGGIAISYDEAISQGRTACKRCY